MPKLAAFPKAFMQQLCKDGTMTVSEWIALASELDVQGLEWYAGFLEMEDESNWARFREEVETRGKEIPMVCCSPDFTHPEAAFREIEIEKQFSQKNQLLLSCVLDSLLHHPTCFELPNHQNLSII